MSLIRIKLTLTSLSDNPYSRNKRLLYLILQRLKISLKFSASFERVIQLDDYACTIAIKSSLALISKAKSIVINSNYWSKLYCMHQQFLIAASNPIKLFPPPHTKSRPLVDQRLPTSNMGHQFKTI